MEALLPVLGDEQASVVDAAVRVLGSYKTEAPTNALVARLEKERKGPVLIGLLAAVARGHYAAAQEPVTELLKARDWEVRRRAVLAPIPETLTS